jgi:hypothetical protein
MCVAMTSGPWLLHTRCQERLKFLVKLFGSTVKKALKRKLKQGNPVMWQERSQPHDTVT